MFKGTRVSEKTKPVMTHRPKKYIVSSPFSAWPNVEGRVRRVLLVNPWESQELDPVQLAELTEPTVVHGETTTLTETLQNISALEVENLDKRQRITALEATVVVLTTEAVVQSNKHVSTNDFYLKTKITK